MKKQLKRPKAFLGLAVTLAMLISMFSVAVPVMGASPTFTGDVEADFPTGPDFLTFPDPDGQNVFVPLHPSAPISSGWDIKDVRVTYNSTTDILYVGLNSYQTVGDADTDGGEGTMTYGTGLDVSDLGAGEEVSVYFDLDQDGDWDVIAGVPSASDFSGFTLTTSLGSTASIGFFSTPALTSHLGTVYWNPPSDPDLEFQILDFSTLSDQGGELGAFHIGAFMGSLVDDFTEDNLFASTSPAINIVKMTNGTDNNSAPGPYIAVGDAVNWTYNVTNPGTVPLSSVTVTDSVGGVNPAYVSGDTGNVGFLDPTEAWIYEAYGTATVGQYSNTGTTTGYSDGFNVTDSDPDHYTGVDARISIAPNATNPVGIAHTFNITLEKNLGAGWVAADGVTVSAWLDGSSTAGAITSTGPYITDGSGKVYVTVNSSVAGTAWVHASATVDVDG
ncbi:MAG: hypothetical protein WBH01_01735, partial [Dehalococcoidia bacterium]